MSAAAAIPKDEGPHGVPPFWHEDGDLILRITKNNSNEVLFKIHKVLLVLKSPVFRDMVILGHEVEHKPVPEVPLKGDSVEDVCALLRVLYEGFEIYAETMSFDAALGVLRLSHKYQMDSLRTGIIRLLKQSWPLNRQDYLSLSKGECKVPRITESIKLINAAWCTHTYQLLPTAFYELAIANLSEGPISEREYLNNLSQEHLARLVVGKDRLRMRLHSLQQGCIREAEVLGTLSFWQPDQESIPLSVHRRTYPGGQCSGTSSMQKFAWLDLTVRDERVPFCLEGTFDKWKSITAKHIFGGYLGIDVLCENITSSTFREAGACSSCAEWMVSILQNKATEVWHNIPADFELPELDKAEFNEMRKNIF
ncbi:hypothetical protein M422DRAFT_256779 [Sphaerobolus stellatus SS14]|uniref:BTB domain-containing protein n=1 Tax=Sphaerobolus stellatus (strain SS14) TaxID=990650 RepID=A0A0C9UAR9_SPHS4|nr:hypothetical protein M422DRAFT_256779 [Sphaerobolus stellatus SS14]